MDKIWFTLMNESVDPTLDCLLKKSIESGISTVYYPIGHYYVSVEFMDGSKMTAWNENKYYGWLMEGNIKTRDSEYTWNDARPKKRTMVMLREAIHHYQTK